MLRLKIFLSCSLIVLIALSAFAEQPQKLRWISISSDSKDIVHEIIRSEVENRENFSTSQEDRAEQKAVDREKEVQDAEYKTAVSAANKEFIRTKKKRDEIASQFLASSIDYDESAKGIKTIRATIENLESQISRYEQDIATQKDSLKKWLKTEKQGDVLLAVIYTRGFKDSAHRLESAADSASAPLIAQHMGTYVDSFTKIVNNVSSIDFIRTTEQGTGKWNNEEPLRFELSKNEKGTTYLRLKRYELYPFQESTPDKAKSAPSSANISAAVINSRQDLDSFLAQNGFQSNLGEGRVDSLIRETVQSNASAEEGLSEQVKTFQHRISALQEKIAVAKLESETQKSLLRRKEDTYYKMSLDVAAIRERKDLAERQFHEAQAALNEKKRNHESVIIKTAVVNAKGSQTPAEASAEAILDKLAEVKNDAKTQHSSSTTEVTNLQLTAASTVQSITEARITAVRLISFLNEGDSVRVKMAFRVKTVLQSEPPPAEPLVAQKNKPEPKPEPVFEPEEPKPRPKQKAQPKPEPKIEPKPEPEPEPEIAAEIALPVPGSPAAEALGCRFYLRQVEMKEDGLHLVVEIINTHGDARKVAFYDDSFGSWPRAVIQDESGQKYDTSKAYVLRDGQKTLMVDVDRNGRGIELASRKSGTMELVFETIPKETRKLQIHLHPFIYYKSGRSETWEEFDFPVAHNLPGGGRSQERAAKPDEAPAARKDAITSKNALGLSFNLLSANLDADGLHLLVEVVNKHAHKRKVAFYDDSFGSWNRTTLSDDSGRNHETSKAYGLRNGQKTLMVDIDRGGRGVEILPQQSTTMELVFSSVTADARAVKIKLHPFIYYQNGGSESWEEFDLPMEAALSDKVKGGKKRK